MSKAPNFLPAFVLGIGDFGQTVLNQLDRQARQSFGHQMVDDYLVLRTVGMSPNPLPNSRISYYSVYSDPKAWIEDRHILQKQPILRGWYRPSNIGLNISNAQKVAQEKNRQSLRLLMLKHLDEASQSLVDFLKPDNPDSYQAALSEHGISMVDLFIVMSYRDYAANAILLDIANMMRYVVGRENDTKFKIRGLTLFAALPTAFGLNNAQARSLGAASFAALRELERFSTVFGEARPDIKPKLYPTDSKLHHYNVDELLFDRIFFYSHVPQVHSEHATTYLAEQITDALLPQLDKELGEKWVQIQNNLSARRQNTHAGSTSGLRLDSSFTRTTFFPLRAIQELLSWQLARDVLLVQSQSNLKKDAIKSLLEKWREGQLSKRNNDPVKRCPSVMELLFESIWNPDYKRIFTNNQELIKQQFGRAVSGDNFSDLQKMWRMDYTGNIYNYDRRAGQKYFTELRALIWLQLGDPNHLVRQRNSQFSAQLKVFAEQQSGQYSEALYDLILYLLQNHKLTDTLAVMESLNNALVQAVSDLQEAQKAWSDHSLSTSKFLNSIPGQLWIIDPLFGNQPSETTADLLAAAKNLVFSLMVESFYHVLTNLASQLSEQTNSLMKHLSKWRDFFTDKNKPFYQSISQQAKPNPEDDALQRLALWDNTWAEHLYQSNKGQFIEEFTQRLRWRLENYVHPQIPKFFVSFARNSASEESRDTFAYIPDKGQTHFDLGLWMAMAYAVVEEATQELDFWSYIIDTSPKAPLQKIKAFMKTAPEDLLPFAAGKPLHGDMQYILLMPQLPKRASPMPIEDNKKEEIFQSQTQAYPQTKLEDVSSRNHLSFLVQKSMIDFSQTQAYQTLKALYQDENNQADLYVLAGEASAAKFESNIGRFHVPRNIAIRNMMLERSLSIGLEFPERIDTFILALGIELIKEEVIEDNRQIFALRNPQNSVYRWLSFNENGDFVESFLRFTSNTPLKVNAKDVKEDIADVDYQELEEHIQLVMRNGLYNGDEDEIWDSFKEFAKDVIQERVIWQAVERLENRYGKLNAALKLKIYRLFLYHKRMRDCEEQLQEALSPINQQLLLILYIHSQKYSKDLFDDINRNI